MEENKAFGLTLEDIRRMREAMEPPLETSNHCELEKGADFFAFLDKGSDMLWESELFSNFFRIGGEQIVRCFRLLKPGDGANGFGAFLFVYQNIFYLLTYAKSS